MTSPGALPGMGTMTNATGEFRPAALGTGETTQSSLGSGNSTVAGERHDAERARRQRGRGSRVRVHGSD
jgi:hypothetical protein